MWNYDVWYYQFPLHLVLKKTITHNNFSTCASLFLDFLHLKIVSYSCTPLLDIMCILCRYWELVTKFEDFKYTLGGKYAHYIVCV